MSLDKAKLLSSDRSFLLSHSQRRFFMKKIGLALIGLALCFSLASCSYGGKQTDEKNNLTYTYEDQSITLKAPPKKVLTLSAPLLNMAYAVGGTSIGRPATSSDIPEEAKSLPIIGQVAHINVETLIGLQPDFILGEKKQNGKLESLLQSNKLSYLLINYDGINDNVPLMEFLGKIYGTEDQASKVIKIYQNGIDAAIKRGEQYKPAKVIVLRATGKSVTAETPRSICASMTELLKMHNVISDHKDIDFNLKTVPYSLEQLSADDPEIIFVVTMSKPENMDEVNKKMDEQMRNNPAWKNISAVKNERVYYLPMNLFLMNPGVHTPDALNKLLDLAYEK